MCGGGGERDRENDSRHLFFVDLWSSLFFNKSALENYQNTAVSEAATLCLAFCASDVMFNGDKYGKSVMSQAFCGHHW